MYAEAYLEPSRTQRIKNPVSLRRSQERFIVDDRLSSKYIGFDKILWHRIYSRKALQDVNIYLIWLKSTSKICHCLLVSQINKKLG